MAIAFRPASVEDFDYCAGLYFAAMSPSIDELKLDRIAHMRSLRARWDFKEVRIITYDGSGIGWLQSRTDGNSLFLAQLFVDEAYRRQGIGTEIMRRLIDEAARNGRGMTLGVVKTNPALRLYERLGFRTTHEDDRKFYMRREPTTDRLAVGNQP
jgi:GNAT superfamily N-acetyltransferase